MSADKEKAAKLKALQLTLDKMDKTYGKGAVMKMGDSKVEDVEAISTGFPNNSGPFVVPAIFNC